MYYLNGIEHHTDTPAWSRTAIGGLALVDQKGHAYMRQIGRKGGRSTVRRKGSGWLRVIARRGWAEMRRRLATEGRIPPVCLACGQRLDSNGDCSRGFACGL